MARSLLSEYSVDPVFVEMPFSLIVYCRMSKLRYHDAAKDLDPSILGSSKLQPHIWHTLAGNNIVICFNNSTNPVVEFHLEETLVSAFYRTRAYSYWSVTQGYKNIPYPVMNPAASTRFKLVFFVPLASLAQCKAAIFAAGAGRYPGVGQYSEVCWATTGTGQFRPGPGANPYIGTVGVLEEVQEARVESICMGEEVAKKAVEALKK